MGWFKRFAAIGCGLVGVLSTQRWRLACQPVLTRFLRGQWVVVNGELLPDSVIARGTAAAGNQVSSVSAVVLVAAGR